LVVSYQAVLEKLQIRKDVMMNDDRDNKSLFGYGKPQKKFDIQRRKKAGI
jgi:hypothetical protein